MAGPTSTGGAARARRPGDTTARPTPDLASERIDDAPGIEAADVRDVSISPPSTVTGSTSSASASAVLPGSSSAPTTRTSSGSGVSPSMDRSPDDRNRQTLIDQARDAAYRGLDSQKARAAKGLASAVDALRQSGRQMEGDNAKLASYVDAVANHAERLVGGLRDRDLREMATDLERFARRRPALFLGSAFALGLAAARFLKSSAEPSPGQLPRRGM